MVIALWALLWFWASILTVRPETIITQWEQNKEEINQELAVKMIARLKQSISLNPIDANAHFILARFYEQLVITEIKKKSHEYTQLAEHEYKEAISNQPTNGYLWARLANFYSITSPIEQTVFKALEQAIRYRKYEREAQEVIIPLLLRYWYELPKEIKDEGINLIRHAFKYRINAKSLILEAKNTGTLSIINPLLTKSWHKNLVSKYQKQLAKEKRNNES